MRGQRSAETCRRRFLRRLSELLLTGYNLRRFAQGGPHGCSTHNSYADTAA